MVKDSPQKALSSPKESKALASALMHVLSEGIEHTMGIFSRLQANCLLARRDAVLASSTLPEWDRATLRALPFNSSEFFGPDAAALFTVREKEKQQDALVRIAMVPPKSSGPKRKSFGGQTDGQAKKHKPASASQPSLPQPQATPRPSSFYSKKKALPRSQDWTTSNRQHPQ